MLHKVLNTLATAYNTKSRTAIKLIAKMDEKCGGTTKEEKHPSHSVNQARARENAQLLYLDLLLSCSNFFSNFAITLGRKFTEH